MTPEDKARQLIEILRDPDPEMVEYLHDLWMKIDGDESEGGDGLQSIIGYLLDAWMPLG